jgi:hypothetical protein
MDIRRMLVGDAENSQIFHTVWIFALCTWAVGTALVYLGYYLLRARSEKVGIDIFHPLNLLATLAIYGGVMIAMFLVEPLVIFHGHVFYRAEDFPPGLLYPWIIGHLVAAALIFGGAVYFSENPPDAIIFGSVSVPIASIGLMLLGTLWWPRVFTLDMLLVVTYFSQSLVLGILALGALAAMFFAFVSWLAS